MAISQQKSKVAQTRLITGETAEAFADIIGKSLPTLRSLETGRLKLSEKTAADISQATGVSLRWLLDDKITPAFCDGPPPAEPFTKESYVHHIAKKRRSIFKNDTPELRLMLHLAINDIVTAVYGAAERGNGDIALYYLEKFTEDLGKQFPPAEDRTKAALALISLGESLLGDGVAEEDAHGGDVSLTMQQKTQSSLRKRLE